MAFGSHAASNATVVASSGSSFLALRIIIQTTATYGIHHVRMPRMVSLLSISPRCRLPKNPNPAAKAAQASNRQVAFSPFENGLFRSLNPPTPLEGLGSISCLHRTVEGIRVVTNVEEYCRVLRRNGQ